MRWLVGWSSTAARAPEIGSAGATGGDGETVHPVGSQLLWGDPDPLWAVGDWRPDEVRVVKADEQNRMAVLGTCGASDEELRVGLFAARGGALRHLTAWSGSYTAVVQVGRRLMVCGDLAGVRPVFYTPWAGGTAYSTAALPSPTSSRPTSTSGTWRPCSPLPTYRPRSRTRLRTRVCGAFRRGTR